ncbi:glycoside hydrolase family 6 protein [Streptomyces sp. NPDC101166]|uniref:glycoside hydrolase family 6 protein n=1 Tax=Streptomyces sp. NPDC101166 TaxID=3366120 RepID=UPI0037F8165D
MVAVASGAVALAAAAAMVASSGEGDDTDDGRRGRASEPLRQEASGPRAPASASASPSPTTSPSPSASGRTPAAGASASPAPSATAGRGGRGPAASGRLYRHPESQVADWVRANPGDERRAVIESRIAARPAAVWFADHTPATITSRVRAVTAGAAAQGRVPVLVPYVIPERDCGGASGGGAPDLDAYDAWIDRFAAGLGSGEVIVILEPDAIAYADCLPAQRRAARFASLARAGRVLTAADPRARVYYDAGHSHWNGPARQAELLRQAGAASASSAGIFSNVSNYQRTADEVAYARQVLAALGGPAGLGAVVDTSRNGNGAPAGGQWCDPDGRAVGRAPTLDTGEARVDAYLWVKLPGESDGCKGEAGSFSPSYAYELARSAPSP